MFSIPHSSDYAIAQAATGTVVVGTASGNNTIVAAPGVGSALVFSVIKGQRTDGNTAATTVLYKAGTAGATFQTSILDSNIPGEYIVYASTEMQLQFLPENTPLIANLSAANSITFTVKYLTVGV